jgi:hypothetical protein
VAKPNFQFEKRQKELEKKRRNEEKLRRKQEKKAAGVVDDGAQVRRGPDEARHRWRSSKDQKRATRRRRSPMMR